MSAARQRLFKTWQMTREKHNIYVSKMLHLISSWQRLHLIISESLVAHIEVRHQAMERGFWLFETAVYAEDKVDPPGGCVRAGPPLPRRSPPCLRGAAYAGELKSRH